MGKRRGKERGKGEVVLRPRNIRFQSPKYFTAVMMKFLLGDLMGSITGGIVRVKIRVLIGALIRV